MSPESKDQYKPLKEDGGTVEIGKEEEENEKQGGGEEAVTIKLTVEEMVNK